MLRVVQKSCICKTNWSSYVSYVSRGYCSLVTKVTISNYSGRGIASQENKKNLRGLTTFQMNAIHRNLSML